MQHRSNAGADSRDPRALTIVGRVRKVHGIRGELSVELFTDSPDAIFASGARVFMGTTPGPEPASHLAVVLRAASPLGDGLRVQLEGVNDRNAAELLRGRFFFVPLEEVSPPSDEEVFLHDVIGMTVLTIDGKVLGEVQGWYELPQGVMLDIKGEGQEALVPYREEFVRAVDAGKRQIVVELPTGYLD